MKHIITITALFFATSLFAETATENNETNITAAVEQAVESMEKATETAKCQAGKCGAKEDMKKMAPDVRP